MQNYTTIAREVFSLEADAILGLAKQIDEQFDLAVDMILKSQGRVILCGIGKSGIIARKISSSLASTGIQSFFMHPAEAILGDLGVINKKDILIAISYSGETSEISKLLPFLHQNENLIIAITANKQSTLAKNSSCTLCINIEKEACPLQLVPTSSTTAALVMGDALVVALMSARKFLSENFAKFHPGGTLGRLLLNKVKDEMITNHLPIVYDNEDMKNVISLITKNGNGIAIVKKGKSIIGVITDGDLRRAIDKYESNFFSLKSVDVMSTNPARVSQNTSVMNAYEIMQGKKIHVLLVCEGDELLGIFKE
jgi:arabinose-5-phosphate isomerase